MEEYYYDSTLTGAELDAALAKVAQIDTALSGAQEARQAAAASAQDAGESARKAGQSAAEAAASAAAAQTDAAAAAESRAAAQTGAEAAEAAASGARDSAAAAAESAAEAAAQADRTDARAAAAAANALAAQASAEDAASSADTAKEAADRAQSISQGALGYYARAENLRADHATGENGQWAIVGETDTIWVWDGDTGAWTDSGNKTDLSNYYTKDQTDAELDELQKTLHADLESTTKELTRTVETARTEALGMVLYLYSAALTAAGWDGTDDTGYTQTAACTPEREGQKAAGPAVTADTQLGIPMARPSGAREADEALQAALGIVNGGTSKPGEGTVTVKVWEKPETDITVFWYGR